MTVYREEKKKFPVASATVIGKNKCVKRGPGNKLVQCTVAGEAGVGISVGESKAGETNDVAVHVLVLYSGLEGTAGEDIDVSTATTSVRLTTDTSGDLVTTTTASHATWGYARKDADDGEIVEFDCDGS